MANPEHLDRLGYGESRPVAARGLDDGNPNIVTWNQWREDNPHIIPDLSGADLTKACLTKANLTNANLDDAILYKACLPGADFSHANLFQANLSEADLWQSNFSSATLACADLRRAYLHDTDFAEANLSMADLRGAKLEGADFTRAFLNNADLSNASIVGARFILTSLVEANLEGANLNDCEVYGVSAWDVKTDEKTKQNGLVISAHDEPRITVDDIEMAQFVRLLLSHSNLRKIINSVTEKGVLLLGRFGAGGLEVLQAVAAELRERGYRPMIFDFNRPADRNYTEVVKTLVGLSRFVIVDLSGPSVPQELYATVPHFKIPFVPIIEEGRKEYAMFVDILEYEWVLKPLVKFENIQALKEMLPTKIIEPAEEQLQKRQQLLKQLFNQ